MIINAKIVETFLNDEYFQIKYQTTVDGQPAMGILPVNLSNESIKRMLAICGVSQWENVVGSAIRLDIEHEEERNFKVKNVGHFIDDKWLIEAQTIKPEDFVIDNDNVPAGDEVVESNAN